MIIPAILVVEIVLLIAAALIVLSILWSTVKTGIPPMVSSSKARDTMLSMVAPSDGQTIVDLGSGWGTLVIALAKKHPKCSVIGYEISFVPWLYCRIASRMLKLSNLKVYRQDALKASLADVSVVYCYLMPEGMNKLADSLRQQQYGEVCLISNTFALAGFRPIETVRLNDFYRSPIYLYRLSQVTEHK